jgi:hypothetical protein
MRNIKSLIILILLSLVHLMSPVSAQDNQFAIQINSIEQIFLDDFLIKSTENITRHINQVQKHPGGPVLVPDKPWENNMALLFGSVIFDEQDELYKMWYHCGGGHVGYATSHNGVDWDKPALDIIIRDGQKTNLVIERNKLGHFYEICGVVKDEFDPDPNRRYKLGFVSIDHDYEGPHEATFHKGQRRGLGVATSPDGIHWKLENDFATDDICDISRFFWDKKKNRYLLFGRTKLVSDYENGRWQKWGWGRAVTRLESKDFKNWSSGELMFAADSIDPEGTEIYSMSVFPYSDIYIGCVQMFYGLTTQGNLDVQLASSRDGKNFSRVQPRGTFIPEGDIGDWDRFNISLGNLPPVEVDDELWFYYSGRSYRHGPYDGIDSGPHYGAIGLAKIKRGRFVSLEASFDGGTVITKPLTFSGSHLCINANAKYGSINISLLDQDDTLLSNWQSTISGVDDIQIPVRFSDTDLCDLNDKSIKIKFELKNARLYGFQIKP